MASGKTSVYYLDGDYLTLRLLMSYIYGAPSKARNANVVYIYGPTFGNAETVSFNMLHNVSTLNQCREVSALPNVGPYIYDVSISGFTRSSIYIYI